MFPSLLLIFHFNIFSIMQFFNFMVSHNFSLIFLRFYLHNNCSFVLLLSKSNGSHFQKCFFLNTCSIYICLNEHACICVCVCTCIAHMYRDIHWGQKRALDLVELELYVNSYSWWGRWETNQMQVLWKRNEYY